MQTKKPQTSPLLALTGGVYGEYTNRPFKSQIPGSVRPMKQTSQKFPVVMTSLSAMLLVSLLESRVSKASISDIRKKSISTHSTHLGGDREDTLWMPRKNQKRTASETWIPKLCSIHCPAIGIHGPWLHSFFFRKEKNLILLVGQLIKGINLFPRNHSTFPFVQSNLYVQTTTSHTSAAIQLLLDCKLELQSGLKLRASPKKVSLLPDAHQGLATTLLTGSTDFSILTSLSKHHCKSSRSAPLLTQISAKLSFESSLSLLKVQTMKFQLSVWFLQLPVSSHFMWILIFLQPSTISDFIMRAFFYHRSFLPTSSAASTGSSHTQAQLRAN